MSKSDFGLIGLAVMGQNLVLNVESRGFRVSVYNRTTSVTDQFIAENPGKNLHGAHTMEAFVESVAPDAVNGNEDKEVSVTVPSQTIHFKALPYLTGYAMPNFMFHLTTGYGILRKNGVPLGKGDFIGASR